MTRTEQLILRRLDLARRAIQDADPCAFHVQMTVLAELEMDLIDELTGRTVGQSPIEES